MTNLPLPTAKVSLPMQHSTLQYAIDNMTGVDWNANALEKAKQYYYNMSMSKSAVYDQLTSEYGEQFTASEAQYAIDHLS